MSAPWPGACGSSNPKSTSNPFRHALRACWRPAFVSRDKSRQKRFLQAAAVRGAGRRGRWLGVWHRVLFRDLLARAEWSLGLRVTNGSRLRCLSERGRIDCACTGLLGMLKRVPVRGGEGWWWPGCGRRSCPVAGMVTLPATSCRSGLQAAIGVEPSAPGDASYENLGRQVSPVWAASPTRSQKQQASGSRLQELRSR